MMPVEGESRAASQFSAGSSARAASRQQLQIVDAIGFGMRPDRLQFFGFARCRRDDQLSAIAMGNAVARAILVKLAFTAYAHPRHQAAGLVIDAGMDHLAVPRGGDRADALSRFQHDHFATGLGEAPRDRQTDHARPNYDALNLVHFLGI